MSDPAQLSPSSPEFLQDRLSTLLASPHIHFNKPPMLKNIRMGPGPVDLFSTRFMNFFTHDATGVVAGKEVDHDGLKQALLALQRKWNAQENSFVAQDSAQKVRECSEIPSLLLLHPSHAPRACSDSVADHQVRMDPLGPETASRGHRVCRVSPLSIRLSGRALDGKNRVKEEGGTSRISHLTLDGDESLFTSS